MLKIWIFSNENEMANKASEIIIDLVNKKPNAVIGFATGSSPILTYNKIVEDYKKNGTDWSKITTFNLDEYQGLKPDNDQSYHFFMNTHLFKYLNLNKHNINIPSGVGNLSDITEKYEKKIDSYKVDLQILGLGINGHIGFNEPGTQWSSKTHVVKLTQSTREANSRFYKSIDDVPTHAVTMGISTILKAKQIIMLASGKTKQDAVVHMINGDKDINWPATCLQTHSNVDIILDEEAAAKLINLKNNENIEIIKK